MDGKRLILEQTLTNAYDIKNFTIFIKEFFNNCVVVNKDYKDHWNWPEFSFYINGYTHIGNYSDKDKSKIAIFAVELKKNRSVERARSMQRNFVSKLISNANYDAAIVAFYSKDEPKWRLSLVRLDYEFAKGRAKAKLTPAKRYSYLVGEKEPCHTAMERLLPIFRDDKFNPTLDSIEEAFNVEKVTEEFFTKYREKYYELKEHLDKNQDFNEEAKKHNFTSEQFAKKLMGQLAFLYFLQKKGWLGVKVLPHVINEKEFKNSCYSYNKAARTIVPRVYKQTPGDKYKLDYDELQCLNDEEANILAGCFKAELWRSGTKTFVRDLFNNCTKLQQRGKKNFFDDYLAPLFYEALNHKRGESNYYKRFNCKIPFLNGGLFEPLENYDWKNSKLKIPDDLFSNKHIKGEEDADGILDIFDRYNFTMNEDEPLEREVAVDPEMLGKIFENLLDVKDRKSKGSFYTPREIVHYMCQESLINYLVNETGISYEDIKAFITYGEIMKDEDTGKLSKLGTDEMQIPMSIYNNLKLIDDKLADVRIADPAVGSGAFPMGMISEIVKARNNITAYIAAKFVINSNMSDFEKKMLKEQRARIYDMRNPYKLKRDTIKNSIYAVDIEASAVDIAKLRLWLSLVVEEELEPTFDEQVLGITTQKDPQPLPNLDYNIMCGNSLIDEFEGVKLFDDSVLHRKDQTSETTGSAWQLSLFSDNVDMLLQELFKLQDKYFNEDDAERKSEVKKSIDKVIDNIIRAKLLKDGNAVGLEKYERSLKEKTRPYFLWKLEFAKVFKEKGGFDIVIGNPPYVSAVESSKGDNKIRECLRSKHKQLKGAFDLYTAFLLEGILKTNLRGTYSWIIPNKLLVSKYAEEVLAELKRKGLMFSISLSDIKVFDNVGVYPIIIIGNKLRHNFKELRVEAVEDLKIGCFKEVYKVREYKKFKDFNIKFGSGATGFQAKELVKYISNSKVEGSIPFIVSGSVDKYRIDYENIRYMGKKYDRAFILKGEGVADSKWKFWNDEKIIVAGMTKVIEAVYCKTPLALGVGVYAIYEYGNFNPKFLLGLLNSKFLSFYLNVEFKEKHLAGGYLAINKSTLEQLPLVEADKRIQDKIATLVDEINLLTGEENEIRKYMTELNEEIDRLIYTLYKLTPQEINKIEEFFEKGRLSDPSY